MKTTTLLLSVLSLIACIRAQAAPPTVSEVTCSSNAGGQTVPVIQVKRVAFPDGDSAFQETVFFKPLQNPLFCMADAANMPGNIKCRNANSLDPQVSINITSVDGVLNLGEMVLKGKKTGLSCRVRFAD